MGERESGRSQTLGERMLRRRVWALQGTSRCSRAMGASVAGKREGTIAGGYKRGEDRGVREGAEGKERTYRRERERAVVAVREGVSRRGQRAYLNWAEWGMGGQS